LMDCLIWLLNTQSRFTLTNRSNSPSISW